MELPNERAGSKEAFHGLLSAFLIHLGLWERETHFGIILHNKKDIKK